MRRALTFLSVLVTALYPMAIYLGQGQIEPRMMAGLLALAGSMRLLQVGFGQAALGWLAATLLLALIAVWSNGLLPLKLYPVLVNIALLAAFAYSLIYPPSMIERLARLRHPQLPPRAVAYTRRVTQVWCGFFVVNGALAFWTALYASPALWSLYNGLIAYLLMGLLFAGEYCVRGWVRRQLYE